MATQEMRAVLPTPPKLLDQVRNAIRRRHYSYRTEETYIHWIKMESGYDIRTVQELLGHDSVETTMVYTHVMNKGGRGVKSPLDSGGAGQPPLAREITADYRLLAVRPPRSSAGRTRSGIGSLPERASGRGM